jgi:hypothetical protein
MLVAKESHPQDARFMAGKQPPTSEFSKLAIHLNTN